MTKVLFVCHGNICRSPMAEFVMRDPVMKAGRANEIKVDSSATTSEEIGNPVHPGTKRTLAAHNVACVGHVAKRIAREDYKKWDLIVCMDDENVHDLNRLFKNDPEGKVHKLLEYAPGYTPGRPARDVADPWYTGDFNAIWEDVLAGCQGLLSQI